jgi:hypothetical protein
VVEVGVFVSEDSPSTDPRFKAYLPSAPVRNLVDSFESSSDFKSLQTVEKRLQEVRQTVKEAYAKQRNRYEQLRKEAGPDWMDKLYGEKGTLKTDPEYLAGEEERSAANQAERSAINDRDVALEQLNQGIRAKLVEPPGVRGRITLSNSKAGHTAVPVGIRQEADSLQEILHKDAQENVHARVIVKAGRAHCRHDVITVPRSGHATAHELGHVIEHTNPAVKAAAFQFLEHRIRSSPPEQQRERPLRELSPSCGYRKDERGVADRFMDPYMGKSYHDTAFGRREGRRATEVISMGVQFMLKSPAEFLQKDPEMFGFIHDVLKGKVVRGA